MTRTMEFEALQEMLSERRYRELKDALAEMNEVDIAEFILEQPAEKTVLLFRMLPKEIAADVFSNLESDVQETIIASITDFELREIMDDLFVDDAVDMLEELPSNMVKRVLKNTAPEDRKLLNQFLRYPDDSAGSIMTAEFIDLKETMTVEDAIKRIRRIGEDAEMIYTCYVTDSRRHLIGVVTVKDLLLAQDDDKVIDLMEEDVMKVSTQTDQEEVARMFSKYDMLAMPVVDNENRLVGMVTIDDAVDVLEEEATEDIQKMAGQLPSEKPYLRMGIFETVKKRLPWLMILMISATVSGKILQNFEAAFVAIPMLVTCIPMLMDTSGNAGAQTSASIIRGLALKEVQTRDILKIVWREIRVSLCLGICLAAVNYVRLMIMFPHHYLESLVVSITAVAAICLANLMAGIMPIFATKIHLDPALVATPIITTVADALALISYFMIAKALLPI
ncbi:MAG: magnesium transporter [Lachnospiraceae bacterium]|nr:magnesium transporter [Lachnospiraceae bacterium]MBR0107301.1 magnesium transporter [Lachnospiraceae bacterium]